ncbi:MAG: hypothetical protein KIT11_02755 [Fimbriimonadaceae bacterium]|nr:hypothetical protein [Fimbriimonadaceae bacterium]QYK54711.1 MAG: hypothetical protein KF733_06770 [Fimbriimonadaceae bacterium]
MSPATASRGRLELVLFGTVCLRKGDCRLDRFPTAKARELLVYLGLHGSEPVPRLWLNRILWPMVEPREARNRLSVTLYNLRRSAAEAGTGLGDALQVDRHNVRLDPEEVFVDAQHFFRALADCDSTPDAGRLALFRSAVELYGGPLATDTDAAWLAPLREQADKLYQEAANILCDDARSRGDTAMAMAFEAKALRGPKVSLR